MYLRLPNRIISYDDSNYSQSVLLTFDRILIYDPLFIRQARSFFLTHIWNYPWKSSNVSSSFCTDNFVYFWHLGLFAFCDYGWSADNRASTRVSTRLLRSLREKHADDSKLTLRSYIHISLTFVIVQLFWLKIWFQFFTPRKECRSKILPHSLRHV